MNKPYTTLFLLQSLDGKISTGSVDERDTDKDLRHIVGVKEGLQQYYDLEQKTDLWSLNTGRVMAKIGVNERTKEPKKIGVSFVIVDNKPHLTEQGIRYISQWVKKLVLVTNNDNHPVNSIVPELSNVVVESFESPAQTLTTLKEKYTVERLTIQTGGTFNATWIREGLIDEVSIVVAPMLVGGKDTQSLIGGKSFKTFEDLQHIKALEMIECKKLDHSYLHLRYQVIQETKID